MADGRWEARWSFGLALMSYCRSGVRRGVGSPWRDRPWEWSAMEFQWISRKKKRRPWRWRLGCGVASQGESMVVGIMVMMATARSRWIRVRVRIRRGLNRK